MVISEIEFEWDLSKEKINASKHGYSFKEAVETFEDPNGLVLVDRKHSTAESRFYWVGRSRSNQILTVWFTMRGAKIRIIGCASWRRLRRIYYEATKTE